MRSGEPVLEPTQDRSSYIQGCLLQHKGEVNATACSKCSAGNGLFADCVSLKGFFKGACANCQYDSKGSTCEHHSEFAKPKTTKRKRNDNSEVVSKSALDLRRDELEIDKKRRISELQFLITMYYEYIEEAQRKMREVMREELV